MPDSITNIGIGAVGGLLFRPLLSAVLRDVARRLTLTYYGVMVFDSMLGWLFSGPRWRGEWNICWQTDSGNFTPDNADISTLYRCFGIVAIKGVGYTPDGPIYYTFIGKLSRSTTILTGTWFDRSDRSGGYHGAFQLRRPASKDVATGKWIGFSDTGVAINEGPLIWEKVSD